MLVGSNEKRTLHGTVNPTNIVSISTLLGKMDLTQIEIELHNHLNYSQTRKWLYSPILLFKLLIVHSFRKQSYRKFIKSLTLEDCIALGIPEIEPGRYHIPSASNLHDFAYNRLRLDGFKKIMYLNGTIACQSIQNGHGMVDSTPIEASRYDKYAEYNPHYTCRMYKYHIFHLNNFPLYGIFSEGNAHDSPYAIPLAEIVGTMNPSMIKVQLDGGYDSFMIYARYWRIFRIQPLIDPSKNAVLNIEGTSERIDHWVNKKWKKGGDIRDSIEKKLLFLTNNGREKQVGMYLRNQNLLNPNFKTEYKSRSDCERTHSHMKRMFNFSVKWIQKRSKEFYMTLNFISYQFVLLANLVKNQGKGQDLSKYY